MANNDSPFLIEATDDETEAWIRFLDVAQKLRIATAELVQKESELEPGNLTLKLLRSEIKGLQADMAAALDEVKAHVSRWNDHDERARNELEADPVPSDDDMDMSEDKLPSAEEHRILSQLLQAAVAIVRKKSGDKDRTVHKADVLEEMITRGHFPLECGLKFFEIVNLAEERELLDQLEGEDAGYIELLW